MARLNWGASGARRFENGVDRGVLYPISAIGVPWNGLIAVEESPQGGQPKPYYLDGIKYLNMSTREEFEARITAFSSPPEFDMSRGVRSLQNGLFATQQRRVGFGFSYRTMIGSDLGPSVGYKLHLVYNALASPSSRSNKTLGADVDPTTYNWQVTTVPPEVSGVMPTAHFVIDSRYTPRGLLAAVEDILYGTPDLDPRLPAGSELIAMFQSEGPLVRTNYFTNPSFRATNGTVEVRRNLALSPRFTTLANGWNGTSIDVGGVVKATSGFANGYAATPGSMHTVALDVTAPAGAPVTFSLTIRPTTDNLFGSNPYAPTTVTVPAGETQRVVNTYTLPSGANGFRPYFTSTVGDGSVIVDRFQWESFDGLGPYFDGSTAAADGLTYSWVGTVDASESVATGAKPGGLSFNDPAYFRPWIVTDTDGTKFARAVVAPTSTLNNAPFLSIFPRITTSPGKFVTFSFEARAYGVTLGKRFQVTLYPVNSVGALMPDFATKIYTSEPLPDGWTRYFGYAVIPDGAVAFTPYMYQVSSPAWQKISDGIDLRRFMVEQFDTIPEVLDFFDGSTPDSDGNFYSWSGTPDASTSRLNTWN